MNRKNNAKAPANIPGRRILFLSGLAIVIIVLLIWCFPFFMYSAPCQAVIKIPRNATEKNVADSLSKYFGDSFSSKVLKLARFPQGNPALRHGAYLIQEGDNPISVARRLTHGAQQPVNITINGFRSLENLTNRISAKLDFPADSLRSLLADPEVMAKYGLTPQQALALFIDDTYQVYWSSSPADVIKKIGDNYLAVWNVQRKKKASQLGLSPDQIMTVCSITDEETNAVSEKGTIGRLYINRLNKGMKLQADPTVRFALNDFTIKRVKGEHLKVDSPYNTYKYAGLPPGPIRTTSKTTIDLVLDSKENDYIFMCAKEDFSGTHNFASDYNTHLENARKYQQALDQRGIK